MTDSQQLLAEYVQNGSEAAFRELVARYVALVYSVALRLVEGDTHRAEDVAQTVFVDLARQARRFSNGVMLGGWLHRHTCLVAANTMRGERRRQSRERQAVEMNALQEPADASFSGIAPILDEAINELGEEDRQAVLLRFFERCDFRSIGQVLGGSEDAARMRVNRAVEKLQTLLKRYGVTSSTAALGVALSANAVQATPAGLAATISTAATLAGTAITTTATKAVAMTTLQKTIVTAALAATVGTAVFQAHRASVRRDQVQTLQQQQAQLTEQIARLKSDNERLTDRASRSGEASALPSERLRELLRLRGEVAVLRRQQRDLEQAVAAAQQNTAGPVTQPAQNVTPQPTGPSPFQVQLVADKPEAGTEQVTNAAGEVLQVEPAPLMDYSAIRSAVVTRDAVSGAPRIDVEFNEVGRELFAAITRENLNKRLAIMLDGQAYMAPVIRSEITGGKAEISGNFTEEEARVLADKINEAISGMRAVNAGTE